MFFKHGWEKCRNSGAWKSFERSERKLFSYLYKNQELLLIVVLVIFLVSLYLEKVWPQETEELNLYLEDGNALAVVQSEGCEEILMDEITAVAVGQESGMVYSFVVGKERIEPPVGNKLNAEMIRRYIGTSLALKFVVIRRGCNGSKFDIITEISGWRKRWIVLTDSFYTHGVAKK